jgi:hypothetical protein
LKVFSVIYLMMTFTVVTFTVIESRAQTTETAFLTLFIPAIGPLGGANRFGILTQRLARRRRGAATATRRRGSLLLTQDPFIVTIPTMQGLIGTRKAFIPRRRPDTCHHLQLSRFLLVEFWKFSSKDLFVDIVCIVIVFNE